VQLDTAGNVHDHPATVGLDTLRANIAAVQLDDPARDREPQPGSPITRGTRGVRTVEAFEHA
jgi:hypothetical protein